MTDGDIRTPKYSLQDFDEQIVIEIIAPLSKPDEASFLLDKKLVTFISNPYFLKIKLQCNIFDIPDEQKFDPSTSTFTIKLKKISDNDDEALESNLNEGTSEQNRGSVQDHKHKENEKEKYGFANRYSNIFGKLVDSFLDVINLPDPDNTNSDLRRELRLKEERDKWNDDHYLADTMETDHLESIFNYKPPWITFPIKDLDDERKEILNSCNTLKNFELSEENRKLSQLQIVDVLFCYAYDKRINEGDDSVESGWTINKLSSTLCWFEVFKDMKEVLIACYRRSLIYPLYRNWRLAELVHDDVVNILKAGSAQVTYSLLEVRGIFDESDSRYVLNTIYLNNLCWFSHQMTNEQLIELSKEVKEIKIKKYEVNRDLPLLEVAAHLTLEEEAGGSVKDISNIVDEISKLKLKEGETSSSESTDSTESDSDETGSSQSSDNEN